MSTTTVCGCVSTELGALGSHTIATAMELILPPLTASAISRCMHTTVGTDAKHAKETAWLTTGAGYMALGAGRTVCEDVSTQLRALGSRESLRYARPRNHPPMHLQATIASYMGMGLHGASD